jgi:hypothetical protein
MSLAWRHIYAVLLCIDAKFQACVVNGDWHEPSLPPDADRFRLKQPAAPYLCQEIVQKVCPSIASSYDLPSFPM